MKDRLEKKLREIEKVIRIKYQNERNIGLFQGLSGLALFEFYYSRYFGLQENEEIGSDIIIRCVNSINNGYELSTYARGIAGFGWMLDHLAQEKFIEINIDGLLTTCDDLLHETMVYFVKSGNYDFLHGGGGYAYYFLNRYKNTESDVLKNKYKDIIFDFIDSIEESSEKIGDNKLRWLSTIDAITNKEGYNLCLSHGMASLMGIFTKLCEFEIFENRAKKLLRKLIDYIIDFKNDEKVSGCFFPSVVLLNKEIENRIRVSWCYGDLGLGIRFWDASKVLEDKELKFLSISMLKHVAARVTFDTNLVLDAAVCHGSFGNAQVFNKIYKETGDVIFKNAVDFWMNDGLEKAVHKDGYAGFKQWSGQGDIWVPKYNLLQGVSGIGLTIIDYLSKNNHTWDECLMIN